MTTDDPSLAPPPDPDPYAEERRSMVEQQIRRRGVSDARMLAAMEQAPRHLFVDAVHLRQAYADHPLPIGSGQTISQPYMVARMTELCAVQPTDRVLEVGAGCGYQTTILARLCSHVFATEILPELAERAAHMLARLECTNVTLAVRDGSLGWPEHAPYDVILVAAAAPAVPTALRQQLAEGGRLVVPVGGRDLQVLQRLTRHGDEIVVLEDTPCRFVELRGEQGWDRAPC
jgi:protein-L-isoaspartate(D-aspartate) O-methyltransferase